MTEQRFDAIILGSGTSAYYAADELINHGEPGELLSDWGLDRSGIMKTIQSRVKELLI